MSDLSFAEVMRGVQAEGLILDRKERGRLEVETSALGAEAREVVRLLRETYRWNSGVGIALTRQLGAEDLTSQERLQEEYVKIRRTLTTEDNTRIYNFIAQEGWDGVKEALQRVGP